jgi:hypothetical protein
VPHLNFADDFTSHINGVIEIVVTPRADRIKSFAMSAFLDFVRDIPKRARKVEF